MIVKFITRRLVSNGWCRRRNRSSPCGCSLDMDRHLLAWRGWNRFSRRCELLKTNRVRARFHGLEDEAGDCVARVGRGLNCEIDLPGCCTCRYLGCSRRYSQKLEAGTVIGHAGDGSDYAVQHGSLDVESEFLTRSG